MSENLWPAAFGEVAQKPPVAILREQAQALGERTANIVVGRVALDPEAVNEFSYAFDVYAAPLGYKTELFQVRHGIELYPVRIFVNGDLVHTAAHPEELAARLKDLFAREGTKKTIASLIAQSKE